MPHDFEQTCDRAAVPSVLRELEKAVLLVVVAASHVELRVLHEVKIVPCRKRVEELIELGSLLVGQRDALLLRIFYYGESDRNGD